ncbi:protein ced-11 [Caerostris extrusa]|uniref:Protein ced-11 n=1 Tax=Caerostris extrusa TaxID=172846 RepID=A0AAV4VXD1_CAEEX|nr:protein ced-11 [Caerostris extrusa]
MNVEFGKCYFEKGSYKQYKYKEPIPDEELLSEVGTEDEVKFGRMYHGDHGWDIKHWPFILSSYTAPMNAVFSKIMLDWKLSIPRIVLFVIAGSTDSLSESIKKLEILLIKGLMAAKKDHRDVVVYRWLLSRIWKRFRPRFYKRSRANRVVY